MNNNEVMDDYLLGLLAPAASHAHAPVPPTGIGMASNATPEQIAADLIAELDADPAFAATASAPHASAAQIAADLIAELDADPAFALDTDPAFAQPVADAVPQATRTKPTAAATPSPHAAPPTPVPQMSATTPAPASRQPATLPKQVHVLFQPGMQEAQQPHVTQRNTRWLRLRCGKQIYALELLKVQEVVLPVPLLSLRGTPPSMMGIMNLRGQVVPVLDLGVHLGTAAVTADTYTRIVVLEENGNTMGLRVSAVEDVASLTDRQIEPPDNTRLCRISNHLFRGIARIGTTPMILLDASALLH
jgi:purine-binding chemotaxis protein CheW